MAYNIVYTRSVHRDLRKLAKPEAQRILDHIEKELVRQPEPSPVLKGQFAGLSKCSVGDYRVIYVLLGLSISLSSESATVRMSTGAKSNQGKLRDVVELVELFCRSKEENEGQIYFTMWLAIAI